MIANVNDLQDKKHTDVDGSMSMKAEALESDLYEEVTELDRTKETKQRLHPTSTTISRKFNGIVGHAENC